MIKCYSVGMLNNPCPLNGVSSKVSPSGYHWSSLWEELLCLSSCLTTGFAFWKILYSPLSTIANIRRNEEYPFLRIALYRFAAWLLWLQFGGLWVILSLTTDFFILGFMASLGIQFLQKLKGLLVYLFHAWMTTTKVLF